MSLFGGICISGMQVNPTQSTKCHALSHFLQVLVHSPPSLRHFVTQGLLPPVVVLECGFSLPVGGCVRTFDWWNGRVCMSCNYLVALARARIRGLGCRGKVP